MPLESVANQGNGSRCQRRFSHTDDHPCQEKLRGITCKPTKQRARTPDQRPNTNEHQAFTAVYQQPHRDDHKTIGKCKRGALQEACLSIGQYQFLTHRINKNIENQPMDVADERYQKQQHQQPEITRAEPITRFRCIDLSSHYQKSHPMVA